MLNTKKAYYSIREVCGQTGLEPHVLRYWESEFPQLRPKKNRAGNRAYRDKDIEVIKAIQFLLYEEQYTIPGAKKKIAEHKEDLSVIPSAQHSGDSHLSDAPSALRETLDGLRDLLKTLTN
jgi:DNA-binding transcriptional MerR regulator